MAQFTVRMVLKNGEWEDYEKLHARMEGKGFSKIILSGDDKRYQLPDAEYNFEGSATSDQVFEKAKAAADGTGRKYSVFVTESKGRTWCGLEPA